MTGSTKGSSRRTNELAQRLSKSRSGMPRRVVDTSLLEIASPSTGLLNKPSPANKEEERIASRYARAAFLPTRQFTSPSKERVLKSPSPPPPKEMPRPSTPVDTAKDKWSQYAKNHRVKSPHQDRPGYPSSFKATRSPSPHAAPSPPPPHPRSPSPLMKDHSVMRGNVPSRARMTHTRHDSFGSREEDQHSDIDSQGEPSGRKDRSQRDRSRSGRDKRSSSKRDGRRSSRRKERDSSGSRRKNGEPSRGRRRKDRDSSRSQRGSDRKERSSNDKERSRRNSKDDRRKDRREDDERRSRRKDRHEDDERRSDRHDRSGRDERSSRDYHHHSDRYDHNGRDESDRAYYSRSDRYSRNGRDESGRDYYHRSDHYASNGRDEPRHGNDESNRYESRGNDEDYYRRTDRHVSGENEHRRVEPEDVKQVRSIHSDSRSVQHRTDLYRQVSSPSPASFQGRHEELRDKVQRKMQADRKGDEEAQDSTKARPQTAPRSYRYSTPEKQQPAKDSSKSASPFPLKMWRPIGVKQTTASSKSTGPSPSISKKTIASPSQIQKSAAATSSPLRSVLRRYQSAGRADQQTDTSTKDVRPVFQRYHSAGRATMESSKTTTATQGGARPLLHRYHSAGRATKASQSVSAPTERDNRPIFQRYHSAGRATKSASPATFASPSRRVKAVSSEASKEPIVQFSKGTKAPAKSPVLDNRIKQPSPILHRYQFGRPEMSQSSVAKEEEPLPAPKEEDDTETASPISLDPVESESKLSLEEVSVENPSDESPYEDNESPGTREAPQAEMPLDVSAMPTSEAPSVSPSVMNKEREVETLSSSVRDQAKLDTGSPVRTRGMSLPSYGPPVVQVNDEGKRGESGLESEGGTMSSIQRARAWGAPPSKPLEAHATGAVESQTTETEKAEDHQSGNDAIDSMSPFQRARAFAEANCAKQQTKPAPAINTTPTRRIVQPQSRVLSPPQVNSVVKSRKNSMKDVFSQDEGEKLALLGSEVKESSKFDDDVTDSILEQPSDEMMPDIVDVKSGDSRALSSTPDLQYPMETTSSESLEVGSTINDSQENAFDWARSLATGLGKQQQTIVPARKQPASNQTENKASKTRVEGRTAPVSPRNKYQKRMTQNTVSSPPLRKAGAKPSPVLSRYMSHQNAPNELEKPVEVERPSSFHEARARMLAGAQKRREQQPEPTPFEQARAAALRMQKKAAPTADSSKPMTAFEQARAVAVNNVVNNTKKPSFRPVGRKPGTKLSRSQDSLYSQSKSGSSDLGIGSVTKEIRHAHSVHSLSTGVKSPSTVQLGIATTEDSWQQDAKVSHSLSDQSDILSDPVLSDGKTVEDPVEKPALKSETKLENDDTVEPGSRRTMQSAMKAEPSSEHQVEADVNAEPINPMVLVGLEGCEDEKDNVAHEVCVSSELEADEDASNLKGGDTILPAPSGEAESEAAVCSLPAVSQLPIDDRHFFQEARQVLTNCSSSVITAPKEDKGAEVGETEPTVKVAFKASLKHETHKKVVSPRNSADRPWNADRQALSPRSWHNFQACFDQTSLEDADYVNNEKVESDLEKRDPVPVSALVRGNPGGVEEFAEDSSSEAAATAYQVPAPSDSYAHARAQAKATTAPGASKTVLDEAIQSNSAAPKTLKMTESKPKPVVIKAQIEGSPVVFGEPSTFGPAGGDNTDAPKSPRISARAKALNDWNGGVESRDEILTRGPRFANNSAPEPVVESNEAPESTRSVRPPSSEGATSILAFWKDKDPNKEEEEEDAVVDPFSTNFSESILTSPPKSDFDPFRADDPFFATSFFAGDSGFK